MSVIKLLGNASNHHEDGLADPLARFAIVLAALVHDVDHCGLPNTQLNIEKSDVAVKYNGLSVAEQNSLDVTWNLLMKDAYKEFRRALYSTTQDLVRFRSLLVHAVLVTDIVNKDLQSQRKARWERVFGSVADAEGPKASPNERGTALLELVIQASDVSHTMQHWHTYRQWNESLFHEMMVAWKEGRAEKDPRENWYEGEIGFFKFYILPLAERVKYSSAFGALGAELYHCAQSNLEEWEIKGKGIVDELAKKYSENGW